MTRRWRRLESVVGALALGVLVLPAQAGVRYIHTDALGSVVAMTNTSAQVIERREYEPYGAQLIPTVQDGPGYTGHVQDAATGLVYMQQRYYDPGIGRMLSVDPVTAYDGDLAYFTRYAYAGNNPYSFTDPDGRMIKGIGDPLWGGNVFGCRGSLCDQYRGMPGVEKDGDNQPSSEIRSVGPVDIDSYSGGGDGVPELPPGENIKKNIEFAETLNQNGVGPGGLLVFATLVKSEGRWDYKKIEYPRYEAAGNFNYGATGRAAGINAELLKRMAGAIQIWKGTSPPGSSNPFGVYPYGDTIQDQQQISEGIDYYEDNY